jgi:hypothetical protein
MTQAEALAILKTGANVFLTGEPGSGKTHTINEYVAYLRSCGIEPAITASTGIAATHIGGLTIHSWSGIGIRRDLSAYDLDHISQNKTVVRRVENARVLIIDEVSMLSSRTLDMVEVVCREIRRSKDAFGGLQVIVVGDFFQLPPVFTRDEQSGQKTLEGQSQRGEHFAYQSRAWEVLNPLVCYLSEQHRQEDEIFLEFLSSVRRATVGEHHRVLLRTRYSPVPKGGITQLYSRNANVDEINNAELAKVPGTSNVFQMTSQGPEKLVASLKKGCLSPETLSLKVGARVMFTKNDVIMHRYANGTIGVVVDFAKDTGSPIIKTNAGKTIMVEPDEWRIEDGGRVLARISQLPLRLAWAMTVHKSQGMSLDAAHMDLSDAFEYGQGYVALSRVRTLAGLSLAGLNARALEVHPGVQSQDVIFRGQSDDARDTFARMPKAQLETMHTNFIRACGGRIGAGRKIVAPKQVGGTYAVTKALIERKLSLKDMAKERGVTIGTIITHLEKLAVDKQINPSRDLAYFQVHTTRFETMKKALADLYKKEKQMSLSRARESLGSSYGFDELRLARLFVNVE